MAVFQYSIHIVIVLFLAFGLTGSFEFFIPELRKSREIMNPSDKKID
jgi:hypothetical protein